MNIVIPAAGLGSRFEKEGWKKPKPFIDINNNFMLELVIENLSVPNANYFVLMRSEHIHQFRSEINKLESLGVKIIEVPGLTEGTACTVLIAREHIENDKPLLIANSDQIIDFDVNTMIKKMKKNYLDGSILVFEDSEMNPKWSFAKLNEDGLVTQVAEKEPISKFATVGIYLFNKGKDFCRYADQMINNNDRVNNEFYTCPVYNYIISAGRNIGVCKIHMKQMHGIGTPLDLNIYLQNKNFPSSKDSP